MLPVRYRALTSSVIPGGYGSVQPVHDTYLDRVVLFKSMKDNKDNHQLLNEIKGLSSARSRHVVEIYDVVSDDTGAIVGIIIELLDGRSYEDFYKEAATNTDGYLKALYQIATALNDLHCAGIVHRDLKLQNLKQSAAGILKIFDFGISVAADDYITRTNRGTLVYAPPELYVTPSLVTPHYDIYALGICAWALAAAKFPPELLERPPQSSGRAQSISNALPGQLTSEVVSAIDSCLDPIPSNRPTAAFVRAVLHRHLARGQHRGLFVQGSKSVFELSNAKPNVKIRIGTLGTMQVKYDGVYFRITDVSGDVFINNKAAAIGDTLHDACVIGFGAPGLKSGREWVTFSSSHPEVVL